jgi:hypothetical protein
MQRTVGGDEQAACVLNYRVGQENLIKGAANRPIQETMAIIAARQFPGQGVGVQAAVVSL